MELQATGEWFHCKVRRFWRQYLLGSIRVLCFIKTLMHLFGLFKNSRNFNLSGVLLVWNCYPTGESLLSLVHMTDFKMATGKVSGVFRWIPCIIWLDDLKFNTEVIIKGPFHAEWQQGGILSKICHQGLFFFNWILIIFEMFHPNKSFFFSVMYPFVCLCTSIPSADGDQRRAMLFSSKNLNLLCDIYREKRLYLFCIFFF